MQLKGSQDEYDVKTENDIMTVTDKISDRNGIAEFKNIEILKFTNTDMALE